MIYKAYYDSPIGILTLYSDSENLIEVRFPKDRHASKKAYPNVIINDDLDVFKRTKNWLDKYFAGKNPNLNELPLKFIGSAFRKQVWQLLCEIPYGKVVTYKGIARLISPTMSAQAVGNAVGYNPLCIIVPCHRVIGANNNLVGFGGGLDTKKWLLQHEGIDISKMVTPSRGNAL